MHRAKTAKMILSAGDRWMDAFTRAAILESAAGLPPGSWTGGGSTGAVMSALDKAAEHFPALHPLWVTSRDTGTYDAIIRGARKAGGSEEDAEEIAQEVISGFSRSSRVSGGQLGDVGRKLADEIARGAGPSHAQAMLARHGAARAKDRHRYENIREEQRRRTNPSLIHQTPGQVEEGVPHDAPATTLLNEISDEDLVIRALQGPGGNWIYKQLLALWERKGRPSDVTIMRSWLEGGYRTKAEAAHAVGMHPEQLGPAIRRLTAIARDAMLTDPRFRDEIDRQVEMQIELGQLGYGGGTRVATPTREVLQLIRILEQV